MVEVGTPGEVPPSPPTSDLVPKARDSLNPLWETRGHWGIGVEAGNPFLGLVLS